MTANDSIFVSAPANKCEHPERPEMKGNQRLSPFRMVTNGSVRTIEMSTYENIPGGRAMRAMTKNDEISAGNFLQRSRAPSRANQNTAGRVLTGDEATIWPVA